MKIAQEMITPEIAQEYLKFNTENYRSLNKSRVISYSSDMKAGRWQLNGEGIKFNREGRLIDGQHRLQAIVRAGVPVQMLVIRDVEDDVNIYDIGATRSMGQIAKARGIVDKWYSQVVAVAGYIVNNGDTNHMYSGKAAVLDYAEKHEEMITQAVRLSTLGGGNGLCKKSAVIAATYCLLRDGWDGSEIGDFFRIVNSGIPQGHYEASAAFIFRNMVLVNKSHSPEERKLLFSATISAYKDFSGAKARSMKYKFSMDSMELLHRVRMQDGLVGK